MSYVDTHFHLDLWQEADKLVSEIEAKGVYTIAVTNSPSVFDYTFQLTQGKKYIRPAIGLHPELVAQRQSELVLFLKCLSQTRYVGEIGLDYGRRVEEEEIQRKAFLAILKACAEQKNKVLTVHSRNSADDVISMLGNSFPGKVIMHWYSGSLAMLRRGIDYGFFFSVNYAMTTSKRGARLIVEIPADRLLTESDGPFVIIKKTPSSPLSISSVVKNLAGLRKVDHEELACAIIGNFHSLLAGNETNRSLKQPDPVM